MTAFFLTRPEAWTLCTLLHLPVQPGSLMSDWLNAGETPGFPRDAGESLESLAKKAYYDPADEAQPFDAERLAFVLHDMFAMPYDEIGEVLKLAAGQGQQDAGTGFVFLEALGHGSDGFDRVLGLAAGQVNPQHAIPVPVSHQPTSSQCLRPKQATANGGVLRDIPVAAKGRVQSPVTPRTPARR